MIKKICFVILSRANYGSIKSLMKAVQKNKKFKIQVIAGASAVIKKFGEVHKEIKKDGFKIDDYLDFQSAQLNLNSISKTVGTGTVALSKSFEKLKPDFILTVGDRYETMSTAIASTYMNIPLIHTMGGERTGTLDESVRHSISKLAHLHFVANIDAKKRLIKMGEKSKNIFNVGCPRIDIVKKAIKKYSKTKLIKKLNQIGVGEKIEQNDKLIVISQHPVTSEFNKSLKNYKQTILAVNKLNLDGYKIIWLWPNADPGSDEISGFIRTLREKGSTKKVRFITNMSPENYFQLLKECKCIIGNSSSAIREGAFIGVPAVNIGTRQMTRLISKNVTNVNYNQNSIYKAIKYQIKKKSYKSSKIYGDGNAANKIIRILKKIKKIDIQKLNTY